MTVKPAYLEKTGRVHRPSGERQAMTVEPAYSVVLRPLAGEDGGGWIALVPDLPGCMSDGESADEALRNVTDAIEEWKDAAARLGRPIPPPHASPDRSFEPHTPEHVRPPTDLDRRTMRQVMAGKVPIDAVLDLHGLHRDTAHSRLRDFLLSSQAKGHRTVLVIIAAKRAGGRRHGQDLSAPRGVLRRSVPLWLKEPEMRGIVLGYAAASVRHGGEGALCVRLRKGQPRKLEA